MPSAFVPVSFVIQLDNQIQPPQWNAPVVITGANVVTNAAGALVYQPAFTQRPMSEEEFTPEYLQAINSQLNKLGLQMTRVEAAGGANVPANPQ